MINAICYFLSFSVEAIILWQYSANLFVAKSKSKVKLITLCSFYFILFFVSLFGIRWINTVLYFLVNFIFLVTQYRSKWYAALFHSSILTAMMGMCELIVYGIIKLIAPNFLENKRDFHHQVIFAVFSKLIFFTIIYILIHIMKKQEKRIDQYDKSIFLLVLIPLTSVFVMLTFINIGETLTLSISLGWMVALSAVFLLAINLLVFGINQYNQNKNIEFTEIQLLLQKESTLAEYYEMLHLQNENQRILIHDIKKHLQSIDMLNEQKEHDKISAYIRQLTFSSDLKESSRLCDHEMLNSILCRCKQQCANRHISFHIDIRSGTTDFITDNDLTSLFCNLLDNAMEAASSIPDSYIELNTSKREKTPFVVITVINSCRKNPFLQKDGQLSTNKPNKNMHGFGLRSIQKTVYKYYGNMQMYYSDDALTFHTIITLKQSAL